MSDIFFMIMGAIVLVIFVLLWIYIPASMARKRGRSAFGWVILTWILQPLWTIILLAVLGDSSDKIRDDLRNGRS